MKSDTKFLDTFEQGLRRDSVNPETSDKALYEMKNYALNYEGGKARPEVRKGMDRWNTFVLAEACNQLFHFIDLELHELILGVINDRWYVLLETGMHSMIVDEKVTVPTTTTNVKNAPIEMFGNRVVFCTDTNMYWADYDSLNQATPDAYHFGILHPTETLNILDQEEDGHFIQETNHQLVVNKSDQTKIAIPYIPTNDITIHDIHLMLLYSANKGPGYMRITIQTNSAGNPSGTFVNEDARSIWMHVIQANYQYLKYKIFYLADGVKLTGNTTYWIVFECNTEYYTNYSATPGSEFYVAVGTQHDPVTLKYGNPKGYNSNTSHWDTFTHDEAAFIIGGLQGEKIYDYQYTYYNSTYGIESRPSEKSRIEIALPSLNENNPIRQSYSASVRLGAITTPSDKQIDKIRIYRRLLDEGATIDTFDKNIINEYHWVADVDLNTIYLDSTDTEYLGAIIQTTDHYCYDEEGKSDSATRDKFLPAVISQWKGRLWTVESNKNIIIFSKKLEQDGATGLTGTPIPDFFPPETRIETPMPASIIAVKPLANDQLAIYFRNVSIWLLWGMDAPLNPPADYRFIEPVTENGLIASTALASVKSRHIYLSRNGVYAFQGQSQPEHLSEPIDSIIRALPDSYVAKSVLVAFGEEIWLMLDTDGDGYGDDIYILDLQKSMPAWRMYNYGIKMGDLVIRNSGTEYQSILASDVTNEQIVQLENGTDDDGKWIEAVLKTHDIRVATSGTVTGIELLGYYPDFPPSYEVVVSEFDGTVHPFRLHPTSSRDKRGHKYGLRVNSFGALKVKITQLAKTGNQLLGYLINFNRK